MSYDVILLARNAFSLSDLALVKEQLQSIADALEGDLFIAPRELWTNGERVGTLCLPGDFAFAAPQTPTWKQFSHLAHQAGLQLYDPQRGKQIQPEHFGAQEWP